MKTKVYDTLLAKVEPYKHKEERRIKDANLLKTYDMVFDNRTMMTIYRLINTKKIGTVDYPISTGKEAVVFHATSIDGAPYAMKVYGLSSTVFKSMGKYIQGDPRFKGIHKRRSDMIYTWASKEFKNLQRFYKAKVRVPMPFHQLKNTLIMEYIGKDEGAAPTMREFFIYLKRKGEDVTPIGERFASKILKYVDNMIMTASLVHCDLSEFNILICPKGRGHDVVVIDVGQSVVLEHPEAYDFFRRDMDNIERYFGSLGIDLDKKIDRMINKAEKRFGISRGATNG